MIEDDIVIVIDTSNYLKSYSEPVPFRAKVQDKYEGEICVVSLATGKEYELYYDQILEWYSDEDLLKFIDVSNYGQ